MVTAIIVGVLVIALSPVATKVIQLAGSDGDVTVAAIDDTYTDGGSLDENNGGSHRLVAGQINGVTKVTYLKFKVTVPFGMQVDRAWVRLKRDLHHLPGTVSLSAVEDTTWTQRSLTARNAPAPGRTLSTVHPDRSTGTISLEAPQLAGTRGGLAAFAVTSPATNDVARFRSTEYGSEGPTLVVRMRPEPVSTIAQPRPSGSAVKPSAAPTTPGAPSASAPGGGPGGPCRVGDKLVPNCGVMIGVAPGAFTSVPPAQALRQFEEKTGRHSTIFHVYHRGDELFPTTDEIKAAQEPGKRRILLANWKVAWGETWADVAAGKVDARIDRLAAHIKATYRDPFFLAIHHEPENDVVTTAGSGMTAKDYAAMFRHTVQRLRAKGATNVVTVAAYMGYENWCIQPWFTDLWPGDDVTDWIAYDPYLNAKPGGYAHGDFSHLVNLTGTPAAWPGFYNWATRVHGNKPLMMAEWGVFEYPADPTRKPWIFSTVSDQLAKFPAIKALVYFDSPAAPKGDTRPDSTAAALNEYRKLADNPAFNVAVG